MFTIGFQVGYLAATLLAFAVVALVTRPSLRRVVGCICAVVAFTAVSAPLDELAAQAGWWTYPSCADPPHPPLAVYLGQSLSFVGCAALVGWRVQRRFGGRGLATFVVLFCTGGFARDMAVAAMLPELIELGPTPAAQLADIGAWLLVAAFALVIPRLVAGPASADAPR